MWIELYEKVILKNNTFIFNRFVYIWLHLIDFFERVAPFNLLFGATQWLDLIDYLESPVAPNLKWSHSFSGVAPNSFSHKGGCKL